MTTPGAVYRRLAALLLWVLLWPVRAGAQPAAADAGAEKAVSSPDTLITLLSLGVGLVAVIAVIFGCAWIIRRMSGLTGGNSRAMKVVSVMPLGTRERIALIEVGGKQVLVGVTPSSIRTLHVFDEPVVDAGDSVSSDFARRLQGMIGKSWGVDQSPKKGS